MQTAKIYTVHINKYGTGLANEIGVLDVKVTPKKVRAETKGGRIFEFKRVFNKNDVSFTPEDALYKARCLSERYLRVAEETVNACREQLERVRKLEQQLQDDRDE